MVVMAEVILSTKITIIIITNNNNNEHYDYGPFIRHSFVFVMDSFSSNTSSMSNTVCIIPLEEVDILRHGRNAEPRRLTGVKVEDATTRH